MSIEALSTRLEALESRTAIDGLISAYANAFDRVDAAFLRDIGHWTPPLIFKDSPESAARGHTGPTAEDS